MRPARRFHGRAGAALYIPASKIHQWHSKYDVFPSEERSKKCGGTSPNGIGLLGKDERRSVVRSRGSKGGNKHKKVHRLQRGERTPSSPVPSIIKSNSAMNVKDDRYRSNKSKDEIGILLRKKMQGPNEPGSRPWRGSPRERERLSR